MSSRLIALIAVIIVFGALTAQALLDVGYFGIFEIQIQTWSGMQVFTDLAIMCVPWMSPAPKFARRISTRPQGRVGREAALISIRSQGRVGGEAGLISTRPEGRVGGEAA